VLLPHLKNNAIMCYTVAVNFLWPSFFKMPSFTCLVLQNGNTSNAPDSLLVKKTKVMCILMHVFCVCVNIEPLLQLWAPPVISMNCPTDLPPRHNVCDFHLFCNHVADRHGHAACHNKQ